MDKIRIRDGINSESGSGINIPDPQHCLQDPVGFYLQGIVAPYSHLGGSVSRGVAVSPEPDEFCNARQYRELMLLPRCLTIGQDAGPGIRIIHRRGIHLIGATGKEKMCWKGFLHYLIKNFRPPN
jgi:hypothetical protein